MLRHRRTSARAWRLALNGLLQERLHPWREGRPEARGGGRAYRPGDRVLQSKNDYDLKVYNGDLGTVGEIGPTEQEERLDLGDRRSTAQIRTGVRDPPDVGADAPSL